MKEKKAKIKAKLREKLIKMQQLRKAKEVTDTQFQQFG